jgi:hypothetical protein
VRIWSDEFGLLTRRETENDIGSERLSLRSLRLKAVDLCRSPNPLSPRNHTSEHGATLLRADVLPGEAPDQAHAVSRSLNKRRRNTSRSQLRQAGKT